MSDQVSITTKILDVLHTEFGDVFTEYYDGDPIAIPRSLLPCLIVDKSSTSVRQGATGMDKLNFTITIVIVANKQDDFNKSATEAVTTGKLERWAEGQDDSGQFSPDSVMGVLRSNLTLDNTVVDQNAQIDYGVSFREGTGEMTAEVRITFTAEQILVVNRSVPAN